MRASWKEREKKVKVCLHQIYSLFYADNCGFVLCIINRSLAYNAGNELGLSHTIGSPIKLLASRGKDSTSKRDAEEVMQSEITVLHNNGKAARFTCAINHDSNFLSFCLRSIKMNQLAIIILSWGKSWGDKCIIK